MADNDEPLDDELEGDPARDPAAEGRLNSGNPLRPPPLEPMETSE